MNSLSVNASRRDTALMYLALSARKLSEATTLEQSLIEAKQRLRYIQLAIQHGCTETEMRVALGISVQHLRELAALEVN